MSDGTGVCKECGFSCPSDANYCPYCGIPRFQRQPIAPKVRYFVLNRDNHTCQYCGRSPQDGVKLHIDHHIPVSWGGTNDPENLLTACDECNLGKGKTLPGQNPYVALMEQRKEAQLIQEEQAIVEREYEKLRGIIEPDLDAKFWFCRAALHNSHWAWNQFSGRRLKKLRDAEKIFLSDLKEAAQTISRSVNSKVDRRYWADEKAYAVGVIFHEVLMRTALRYSNILDDFDTSSLTTAGSIAFERLVSDVRTSATNLPGLFELDDLDFHGAEGADRTVPGRPVHKSIRNWIRSLPFNDQCDIDKRLQTGEQLVRLERDVNRGAVNLCLDRTDDQRGYMIQLPEYLEEFGGSVESVIYWTHQLGDVAEWFLGLPELEVLARKSKTGRDAIASLKRNLIYDERRLLITWRGGHVEYPMSSRSI